MRHFGMIITGAALASLVVCGNSTGPAADRNDPGNGTSTLRVDARIEGRDAVGGFVTDFVVTVLTGEGLPASGAEVTIQNNQLGTVTLLESETGSGVYRAERNSFPEGNFRLDVVSGDDNVHKRLTECFEKFGESVLTHRERQISQLLLRGHSSKSIARELRIAPGTVMVHKRNLFGKLGISSQYELFSMLIDNLGRA